MRTLALAVGLSAALAASAAAQGGGGGTAPVELSAVEVQPELLDRDSVVERLRRLYPAHLRDAGRGGTTYVRFTIGVDGGTADAVVERPSPHPALDSAALAVVAGMRFRPARLDGRDVAASVTLPIAFTAPPPTPDNEYDFEGAGVDASDGVDSLPDERPRLLNADVLAQVLAREYPPALRDVGAGGSVTIRIRVRPDGKPGEVLLIRGSGHAELDRAALRVAQQMHFRAARLRGRPIASWVQVPVNFSATNDPARLPP
jgi:TonB family protein